MSKRNLIYLVICSMMLFATSSAFAESESQFRDIDNSYAKDAILRLSESGILTGTGGGEFKPAADVMRQDFAIIMVKALKLDTSNPPEKPTFSDVPASHYSYAYVEAAFAAGLLSGIGDGKFGLEGLTREAMAVIFINALGVDASGKGETLSFKDAGSISDWAKDSVATALEEKLITGNPDGNFNPHDNADRQAIAAVTDKFLDVKQSQEPTAPENEPEPTPEIKPEPTPEPRPSPIPSTTNNPDPTPEPSTSSPNNSSPTTEQNSPNNPNTPNNPNNPNSPNNQE